MRGWLLAGALVATCALAGCSGDDGGTATPAPGVTGSTAATTAGASADETDTPDTTEATAVAGGAERFVTVVRLQVPDVATGRTDDELAAVAATACEGLSIGLPADRVTADVRSLGTLDAEATDQATARELVKLAIDRVCPGQSARVDEF